ncbi:hypothetical protein HOY82DRAFT_542719 [Tuber indicum]|nr:hypothetical protein HOY82DRAFT_542719 [Tuber indicum]
MLIKVAANGRIGIVEKIFHHPQASFKVATLNHRSILPPHILISASSHSHFVAIVVEGKSVDYIQTRVKKLLAFHENGPKYIAEGVGFGVPENIFGLSEQAIITLGGIIELLGDDITIAEEERNTKTGNKWKAEQDEESRGKANQRIALETRVSRENGSQILHHITENQGKSATSSNPHRRRQCAPKSKHHLQRTQDSRILSNPDVGLSRSSISSTSSDNPSTLQLSLTSQTSIPLRQSFQARTTPPPMSSSDLSSSLSTNHPRDSLPLPTNRLPKLFYDITDPRAECQERQLDSIAASTAQAVVLLEEIRDLLQVQANHDSHYTFSKN